MLQQSFQGYQDCYDTHSDDVLSIRSTYESLQRIDSHFDCTFCSFVFRWCEPKLIRVYLQMLEGTNWDYLILIDILDVERDKKNYHIYFLIAAM